MSSSTLVPVYHYSILGDYFINPINYANYILHLISVSINVTY